MELVDRPSRFITVQSAPRHVVARASACRVGIHADVRVVSKSSGRFTRRQPERV